MSERRSVARAIRAAAAVAPSLTRGFWLSALLALVGTAGSVVVPIVIQQVLDREVLGSGPVDVGAVGRAVLLAAAALVAAAFASRTAMQRLVVASARGLSELRVAAFAHIHRLSPLHLQGERRGRLVSRVTSDVDTIGEFVEWGGVGMLVGGAQISITVAVMLVYEWRLAVLVVIGAVVYAALLLLFQRILRREYDQVRIRIGESAAAISETIAGLPTIRAFGVEAEMGGRVDDALDAQFRAQFRTGALGAVMFSSAELFAASLTAGVVAAGVLLAGGAGLTAGMLVAFLFLVTLFIEPVQTLVEVLNEAQSAAAGMRRILGVLDTPVDIADPAPGASPLPPGPVTVRFEAVRFRYPDADRDVLHDVDVTIRAGARVAVVGETGSGKTTFAKLATRLLDRSGGRVTLNDVPIDRIAFATLRDRVTFVPQEGFLFDASLLDNVRYGHPAASEGEVAAAFADLGLDDWFQAQPDGLRTQVGERGGRLSAGERQLVALVRAWIADPDLLVLDEATSAVDPALEVELRRALERLLSGRTSITVAHRLSTAAAADEVLVFDEGRIVERGPHAELIGSDGVYAALWADWMRSSA